MRIRTRSTIKEATSREIDYYHIPFPPRSETYDYTGYEDGKREIFADLVNPRFKTRQAKGEVIMTPMEKVTCELQQPIRDFQYNIQTRRRNSEADPWVVTDWQESYAPNHLPTQRWKADLVHPRLAVDKLFYEWFDGAFRPHADLYSAGQLTLTKCLAEAASSPVLAMVTMREFDKTLESVSRLGTLVPRILKFVLDADAPFKGTAKAKRRRKRLLTPGGLVKIPVDLMSQWLEYRYGFMQVLYDIESFMEAANGAGKARRVRFVSSWSGTGSPEQSVVSGSTNWYDETKSRQRYRSDKVTSGCLIKAQSADPLEMPELLGFDRIGSTIWELMPLSFIVDWALNAGEKIAAHEGRFNQRVCGTWTTYQATGTQVHQLVRKNRQYQSATVWYTGECSTNLLSVETTRIKRRVVNPELSILPQLKLRLNTAKVIDALSLAGQAMHKAFSAR